MIVEDNPSGHRLVYVRYLAEAALGENARVTLAVSRAVSGSSEFALQLGAVHDRVAISVEDHLTSPGHVRAVARRLKPSRTIVPDGDVFAARLGVARRWAAPGTLAVLLMRDAGQQLIGVSCRRQWRLAVKRWAIGRARRRSGASIVALRSALYRASPGERIALDPVEVLVSPADVTTLRAAWGVDPGVFWFSVIGAITARKNLALVANALAVAAARLRPQPVGLLVAGPCHESVRVEARSALGRLAASGVLVVQIDRLLDNDEVDAAVAMSDCVVVAHSNEGPSSFVAKSAVCGVRVAAAGAATLRDDVAQLESSRWCSLDLDALAAELVEVMSLPAPAPRTDLGAVQFCAALLHDS